MKVKNILDKVLPDEKWDDKIFSTAFTHSSVASKLNVESNERLEFLGDSIINYLVTLYLFDKFKNIQEGDLSKFRANLVCTKTLEQVCDSLNLASDYKVTGELSSKMKADLFEAFIGAVHSCIKLDKENKIYKFLNVVLFIPFGSKVLKNVDYKTKLQEELQAKGPLSISYVHKPVYINNEKLFEVSLMDGQTVIAKAKAKSVKQAEQEVAKIALNKKQ